MDNQQELFDKLSSSIEEERLQALRMLDLSSSEVRNYLLLSLGDESWRVRKEAVSLILLQPWCDEIVEDLIALLYSDDNAGLRNSSHEILVQLGNNAVTRLIDQMHVDDHDVRKFIVDILGDIGSPAAIDSLIETLRDPDQNVRSAAAENLGKLKAKVAVPNLLASLVDEELLFRFSIIDALGKIGTEVSAESFSALVDEPLLKKPLITCFGEIGGLESCNFIVSALTEPKLSVRLSAVRALCKFVERYPDALTSADQSSKKIIVTQLSTVLDGASDELVNSIVTLLGNLGEPTAAPVIFKYLFLEEFQSAAFHALMKIGERGLCELLTSYKTPTANECAYLCYLVGEIGYREGLPFLIQSFASPDPEVQQVAVQALGKVGDEDSIPVLVESLISDDRNMRETVVSALASLSVSFSETVLAALHPLFESNSQYARASAVEILGKMGGEELGQYLVLALKDPSAVVRRAALGVMDSEFAKAHLETLRFSLTDEDVDVRKEVIELLGRTSDIASLEIIRLVIANDADLWVRTTAIRSLIHYPLGSVKEILISLLRDNSGPLALASLDTLMELSGMTTDVCSVVFQHSDGEVVKEGLEILTRNTLYDEMADVVTLLLDRQEIDIKIALIRSVAMSSSEDLIKSVRQQFINDPDDTVRNEVAQCFNSLSGV